MDAHLVVDSLLAIIAFLQFLVFGWQGYQLRASVLASKREYISTHRPRIRVRQFVLSTANPGRAGFVIRFDIANVGDTSATVQSQSVAFVHGWSGRPQMPPQRTDHLTALAIGTGHHHVPAQYQSGFRIERNEFAPR